MKFNRLNYFGKLQIPHKLHHTTENMSTGVPLKWKTLGFDIKKPRFQKTTPLNIQFEGKLSELTSSKPNGQTRITRH